MNVSSAIREAFGQIGLAEGISIIKDVIVLVATIVTAVVAVRSLRAWRRQLRGTTKHQVAGRALTALHTLHDAIVDARQTLAHAVAVRRTKAFGGPGFIVDGASDPYQLADLAMQEVEIAQSELLAAQRQAQIYLGSDASEHLRPILEWTLPFRTAYVLHWKMDQHKHPTAYDPPSEQPHILYAREKGDSYAAELTAAVRSIEPHFQKYL